MTNKSSKIAGLAAAAGLLTLSSAALATNGYFTHGVGTESKGMAGTGIGSNAAHGPIVAASNPALSVFAEDGWEIGLSLFSPLRSYKATSSFLNGQQGSFTVGEGKFDSGSTLFPIPYVAKNFRLNDDNVIGLVFYGRGGMNTDWDDPKGTGTSAICDFNPADGQQVVSGPGPFCSGEAGVDLSQAFLMVSYSGRVSDRFAWGIGPVFAAQAFEAKGVASYAPFTKTFNECFDFTFTSPTGFICDPTPTALTNNGHEFSTGFGFAGGVWFALTDAIGLGLSYQSEISMSEFDDYADLFAEAGGFDIPSSAKLGISFAGLNDVRVNLDVEHTTFNEVDSVGNPMTNLFTCPAAILSRTQDPVAALTLGDFENCLGGKTGGGFGWEDMTTYKVGVEWAATQTSTWRFGYSYGKQPIRDHSITFNILAPGVMEQHFTIGHTRRTNSGAWNFSLMFAPSKTISAANPFDPTQTIDLEMKQYEFEVSYRF